MLATHLHSDISHHLSVAEQWFWEQTCTTTTTPLLRPEQRIAISNLILTESVLLYLTSHYGNGHLLCVPLVKRASLDVLRTPIAAKIIACSPIHRDSTLGIAALCARRSPEVLQYLHETHRLFRRDNIHSLFSTAVSNHDVPTLHWLYTTFTIDAVKPLTQHIFKMILAEDFIAGLEWLYTLPWNVQDPTHDACLTAIECNSLKSLHWLHNPHTGYGAYPQNHRF
jgi:hypothetical protein